MNADAKLKVLLVEDHPALRQGLELLLRADGCEIVGTAAGVADGCRLFAARCPDVVVCDYALADGCGSDLIRRLRETHPAARVVVYTGTTYPTAHDDVLDAGAWGLVLKGSATHLLFEAVRRVGAGQRFIDPATRVPRSRHRLTGRQREILGLLAEGLTGEQAAEQLFLSPETIRTHVRNAMDRLGAQTRVHAVALATQTHEIRC